MAERRVGVIMNGVTGRMGTNQHLIRSILPIRADGGVRLTDGTRILPDPILLGRNAAKLESLAKKHGVERWSTDLDAALAGADDEIYFDAATTELRSENVKRAIAAGKHIYCEKPVSLTINEGRQLVQAVQRHGRVFQNGSQYRTRPGIRRPCPILPMPICATAIRLLGATWPSAPRADAGMIMGAAMAPAAAAMNSRLLTRH